MWQSLEILNVSNTLSLKEILWKTQTLLKKLDYRFLVESAKIENGLLLAKLLCQTVILRQIEWRVQNGPVAKNGI